MTSLTEKGFTIEIVPHRFEIFGQLISSCFRCRVPWNVGVWYLLLTTRCRTLHWLFISTTEKATLLLYWVVIRNRSRCFRQGFWGRSFHNTSCISFHLYRCLRCFIVHAAAIAAAFLKLVSIHHGLAVKKDDTWMEQSRNATLPLIGSASEKGSWNRFWRCRRKKKRRCLKCGQWKIYVHIPFSSPILLFKPGCLFSRPRIVIYF